VENDVSSDLDSPSGVVCVSYTDEIAFGVGCIPQKMACFTAWLELREVT
jgi:hypothetical protein